MGQPWNRARGPDGWPEAAGAWITPQVLAARIGWAMRLPGRMVDPLPDPRRFLAHRAGRHRVRGAGASRAARRKRARGGGAGAGLGRLQPTLGDSHGSTRRLLLKSAALAACSAAAHPLMTTVTFAAAPGDNRLVVIVLRGAMDGLDVVQPDGRSASAPAAPRPVGGPDAGAADLDGFFALHPALAPLMPLWQRGRARLRPRRLHPLSRQAQPFRRAGHAGGRAPAMTCRIDARRGRLAEPAAAGDARRDGGDGLCRRAANEMLILTGQAPVRAAGRRMRGCGCRAQARLLLTTSITTTRCSATPRRGDARSRSGGATVDRATWRRAGGQRRGAAGRLRRRPAERRRAHRRLLASPAGTPTRGQPQAHRASR